jgi:hypothetical protein
MKERNKNKIKERKVGVGKPNYDYYNYKFDLKE